MDTDAIDLKYAKEVADFIGAEHTEVIMTKEEVLESLETVIEALATYDITTIRASMGMYLVCKAIHEKTDLKVLLTGEISAINIRTLHRARQPFRKRQQRESVSCTAMMSCVPTGVLRQTAWKPVYPSAISTLSVM